MPPECRQFFGEFHMARILEPTLLLFPKDAIRLPVRTDECHISLPSLPLAAPIAEEHITDETKHRRLPALILSHDHIQRRRRRLPGRAPIDAVL